MPNFSKNEVVLVRYLTYEENMQYDEPFSNTNEMAKLMELSQIAEANERNEEAFELLKRVATEATDAEDRMFGAGTAVLIIINKFLKGSEPKFGTHAYNEVYKYLKIAVENYDKSHPLAQEAFRQGSNIDQFRGFLARMEKEIAHSEKNQDTKQNTGENSQIYLYKNNQQYGPYDEASVRQWLQNGQCSPDDLAIRQGMKEWKPLETLFTANETITETPQSHINKKNGFNERMINILGIMKKSGSSVKDFQVEDESSFEIKTHYSDYDHRTWLKYELTEDGEIVRMQLTHLLGNLDIKAGLNPQQVLETTNQLIDLFKENIPQYRGSSAYLGVRFREGVYFVFLNAAPIFLTKWKDNEIAEVLNVQLFDLETSLMFVPPPPIKQFGVDGE